MLCMGCRLCVEVFGSGVGGNVCGVCMLGCMFECSVVGFGVLVRCRVLGLCVGVRC